MLEIFIGIIILIPSIFILNFIGTLLKPYEDWWEQFGWGMVIMAVFIAIVGFCYNLGNDILSNL